MAAITLEQAKLNTTTDYDPHIIDEFRKHSPLLNLMTFDQAVNPAGGGATLTYGYRRTKTTRGADFRELNKEYETKAATTEKHEVELKPLGGAFEIDRVIAKLGPAASAEIAFQMTETIRGTNAKFMDAVINGDTANEEKGFDGLSKALLSSATEIKTEKDWSSFTSADQSLQVTDDVDELIGELDGPATVLLANKRALAKIRAAARRASMYTVDPVQNLVWANGNTVEVQRYGNLILMDVGAKDGSNDPIIPISDEGKTDIFAVRLGLTGFHGVTTTAGSIIQTWLPDFTTAGAVKKGEVELGPVGVALKSTKAAAVLRGVKVA